MNDIFELVKAQQNIMLSGLKNGEIIGKREGLMLAIKICNERAAAHKLSLPENASYLRGDHAQAATCGRRDEAAHLADRILREIAKMQTHYDINADAITEGIRSNALLLVEQLISNHEMTADERADDPRNGQAKELNK